MNWRAWHLAAGSAGLLLLCLFVGSSGPTPERPLASSALYLLFAAVGLPATHALWLRVTGRGPPDKPPARC